MTETTPKSEILENFGKIPKKVLANAVRMRENAHTKAVVEISKSGGDMASVYRAIIGLKRECAAAHNSILASEAK